jgi:CubicO group peptidase (beta-lactamase class C family)
VVEGARLESVYTRKGIKSSNLLLSANKVDVPGSAGAFFLEPLLRDRRIQSRLLRKAEDCRTSAYFQSLTDHNGKFKLMIQPDITQDYIAALKDFPDQTQLSISFSKQGKTEYFGLLKSEDDIQFVHNADFAFEIGSMTKIFTGTILAQLVIEGKVGIDDPIQPFLPFPMLGDPPITLKHLAQHTSGIQRLPHNFYEQPGYQEENPYARCREEHFAQYFSGLLKLDNVAGEKFQYTNLGMGLLSYIISQIEGKPFPAIVSERVFTQVGMSQSSYDRSTLTSPIVRGIDKDGKFCAHWEAGIYDGALGIISTAKDLTAFALWQLDPSSAACQYQANQSFSSDANVKSLLGWMESIFITGDKHIRIRNLNGGTGGFGASLMINPDSDLALVVLSNCYPYHYLEKIVPVNKQVMLEHS